MRRLSIVVTLFVIAGIAIFIGLNLDDFRAIRLMAPGMLVFAVIGVVGSILAGGVINFVMFRKLGAAISFRDGISLGVLATASNLFLPMRGGLAARAVYMKKVFKFSFTDFAASLVGYYVLIFLVNSVAAVLAVGWMALVDQRQGAELVILGSVGALLFSVFLLAVPPLKENGPFILRKIAQVMNGWRRIHDDRIIVRQLFWISLIEGANFTLTLYGSFGALGLNLSFAELVAMSSLGALSLLLGLTPGGIGIYEAVTAFIGTTIGISPAESFSSSIIYRMVLVVVLLIVAPLCSYHLSHRATALAPEV